MKVTLIPVTPFQQNCSIVVCEATGRAVVVDPGGEVERIISAVEQLEVTVDKVLLTHGHLDHCGGAKALADHYGVEIHGPHTEDAFWIDQLPAQSKRFGFRRRAGLHARPVAAGRRLGSVRRRNHGGLSLPRTYAGPCDLLQPRESRGIGRRRAVRGLDRPYGFSARQPCGPRALRPAKSFGHSATTSRSCRATVPRPRSGMNAAPTRLSPTG